MHKHFIIVEVETQTEQSSKVVEDMVLQYLQLCKINAPSDEFRFASVGWIADNVRPAPTGKQDV